METLLLLFCYGLFAASLLGVAIWSVGVSRPALALCAFFCFMYLAVRPLMLLSGIHGRFGLLHVGAQRFAPADLWIVLVLSVSMIITVLLGYFAFSYRAVTARTFNVLVESSLDSRLWMPIWLACLALYVCGWLVSFDGFTYLYTIIIAGCCYLLKTGQLLKQRWRVVATILVTGIALVCTEERRDWAVAIIALGWLAFFFRSRSIVRKVFFGTVMFAAVAVAAVGLRTEDGLGKRFEKADAELVLSVVELELDFPLVFDDIVILFQRLDGTDSLLYGQSLSKPFYSWVPRTLWPTKPETLSREFSKQFNEHFYANGGSEPLTFLGELYWNFGWFALLFTFLLGAMQRVLDDVYNAASLASLAAPIQGTYLLSVSITLVAMNFYTLRGPIDNVWINYSVLLLICALTARIARRGP